MIEEYLVWDIAKLICSFVSTISVWSLLIAILRSPKVRSNTFNLYLVFCLAPDAVYFLANMLIWVAVTVDDADYEVTQVEVLNFETLSYITIWIDNYWVSSILCLHRVHSNYEAARGEQANEAIPTPGEKTSDYRFNDSSPSFSSLCSRVHFGGLERCEA
jgi:hypothetical protein